MARLQARRQKPWWPADASLQSLDSLWPVRRGQAESTDADRGYTRPKWPQLDRCHRPCALQLDCCVEEIGFHFRWTCGASSGVSSILKEAPDLAACITLSTTHGEAPSPTSRAKGASTSRHWVRARVSRRLGVRHSSADPHREMPSLDLSFYHLTKVPSVLGTRYGALSYDFYNGASSGTWIRLRMPALRDCAARQVADNCRCPPATKSMAGQGSQLDSSMPVSQWHQFRQKTSHQTRKLRSLDRPTRKLSHRPERDPVEARKPLWR